MSPPAGSGGGENLTGAGAGAGAGVLSTFYVLIYARLSNRICNHLDLLTAYVATFVATFVNTSWKISTSQISQNVEKCEENPDLTFIFSG